MQKFNYEIAIKAPKAAVWTVLTDPDQYKVWTRVFCPGSRFEGTWEEGAEMRFLAEGHGGTVARIDECKPHDRISATHIATLTRDGIQETTGDMTEKWIGAKETYRLEESDGVTTLKIEMRTHENFAKMFEDSWPQALESIRSLAESREE